MAKHKLPSGVELDVTPMPTEKAWEITQTLIAELKNIKIDIDAMLTIENIESLSGVDVLRFKDTVCAILSSRVLTGLARECWVRCSYNGLKIDSLTFEDEKARGDFMFAAYHALQDNVLPFFGVAISLLKKS